MRFVCLLIALCLGLGAASQRGFPFIRFGTDDGLGLNSNVVYSLYQDGRGFLWVGTANGLQRFDGAKFIQFGLANPASDPFPYSALTQIIPLDSGRLLLNFPSVRELGIFNPSNFSYKKVAVHTTRPLPAKTDFVAWKDATGAVNLNVLGYGVLRFNQKQNAFLDTNPFSLPQGYSPALKGYYEDEQKGQVWFAGKKGLCVYDRKTGQLWHSGFNPRNLALLKNEALQDGAAQIYIDQRRRFWINTWPRNGLAGQHKYCYDSTGNKFLAADTAGLLSVGFQGYTEYNNFFETSRGHLWVYGLGVLFEWDGAAQRFFNLRSTESAIPNSIEYDVVYQMLEDREGNIWLATNRGLYYTAAGSSESDALNILFREDKEEQNIQDILEMPDGALWFASWGRGLVTLSAGFRPTKEPVYAMPPPAAWPAAYRAAVRLGWTLHRRAATGEVWMGCNGGVLVIYNPQKKTTRYRWPEEVNRSTVRFITEDKTGRLWLATQGGRLLCEEGEGFRVVLDIGNIIYKIFVDREGLLWLATQDKGLYCVEPATGRVVRRWTADGTAAGLYSNTGKDVEQLRDGTIVYGAGALNFINPKTGAVRQLRYEDGLPSNSVERLRTDGEGLLWLITANGLSRYNPANGRITLYGRRDGITLAAKTTAADWFSSTKGYVMFGGAEALILFRPAVFSKPTPPPPVVLTDFRLGNQFIPVDSLMTLPKVRLAPDQNSFSIYFSSLSYQQRDRLRYYYMLEGVDKDWQVAEGVSAPNYAALPHGKYTFKVYAVNVEGLRSPTTTELPITIRPPFWLTKWFLSTLVVLVLLAIYYLHRERVRRLLAVEKLRTRVARDLHDDMGSTLSTINILSAMAKSKMSTDPVKTAGYITKISDNSQRMMEAMDDIVWSIKPANDSLQRVTARMREFATGVLEAKDIALSFSVEETVFEAKLNMEARRDFFLIFKEAMNNAAKYAAATAVEVKVGMQQKQLWFIIRDNGVGFDVAAADGGNGLGNMQKRADGMRGRLRIRSAAGEGTEVRLTVPVG